MRYRFYRVHKFVCFQLADFQSTLAKTDFADSAERAALAIEWEKLTQMLNGHATFEDAVIHQLLKDKQASEHIDIEQEHRLHHEQLQELTKKLKEIDQTSKVELQHSLGYEFLLLYRKFHLETLKHLNDEETIILPKLQSLYSDEALAKLQAKTYAKMNSAQMLAMLQTLFPHMNCEDKIFFIDEILNAEPEKFKLIWPDLRPHLNDKEYRMLCSQYKLPSVENSKSMGSPPRVGVGVLIFNEDNQLLLGKRLQSHGAMTWAPPGGHIEYGESFADCAIREVLEETNLRITQPRVFTITNDLFEPEQKHYISIFMLAKLSGHPQAETMEPHKTQKWQWFDLSKIPDNLFLSLDKIKDQLQGSLMADAL